MFEKRRCGGRTWLWVALLAGGCGDNSQAGNPDAALQQAGDLAAQMDFAGGDGPVFVPDLAISDFAGSDLTMPPDLTMPIDLPVFDGMSPPQIDMAKLPCGNTQKSCGAPGACADCTAGAKGTACVATANGPACGCNSEVDCPTGSSCDLASHTCTKSCNANQPCSGGCCDGANCQPGTAAGACGANGGACAICAQKSVGHLCNAANGGGACGCASANDCPNGSACMNGQCVVSCSQGNACNGGCCTQTQNGTCQAGTSKTQCGGMGVCADCTNNPGGHACVPNKLLCGCITAADCPAGKACDAGSATCTSTCNANQPCNGGCCAGGTCAAGAQPGACGSGGTICVDCATSVAGGVCLAGSCGCNGASDCPVGSACDTVKHSCTKSCGLAQVCNGGCCNTVTMLCVTGTTNDQCAQAGRPMCQSCAGTPNGSSCLNFNNTTFCGCQTAADCPTGKSCDPAKHLCASSCNVNQPCNGGCCDGANCQPGTQAAACGASGGLCASCANNNLGHVCNAANGGGSCGCVVAGDCVNGTACMNGQCQVACSQNAPCNNGCCSAAQNGMCLPGTANGACGSGIVCMSCANSQFGHVCLPNTQVCGCQSVTDCPAGKACDQKTGLCTAGCSANQPCNGGCCAGGICAGGTAKNACGAGGNICLDCSGSPSGTQCINGSCGCGGTADCATGFACDLNSHLCTKTCNANQACNGGCCALGSCALGASASACGAAGAACVDCTTSMTGHACLAGTCGCSGAGDCPGGTSCDPVAHKCTASCGANQPCNGGCCDGANCQTGTTAAQCGSNGGLCASCANSALGHLCNAAMGGGACGCVSANDCPNGSTCAAGLCSKGCSMNAPCNSGCCSNAQNGSCQPGSSATLCGGTGTLCVDCSASPSGHTCLANKLACGCTRTADCPTGKACDLGTSTCTAACNANQLCNGGCCAGGTCGGGTAAAACGAGGSTCADCTGSANGHLCLGGACGCNAASDCAASLACDSVTHLCTKACTGNQLCNGGCCAGGQCQPGTTIGFCGSSGGACFTCGNDKPSCVAGACTSACGALGNGPCNGGFCCSNGQCVNGLDSTHCGFSGTCFSCAGNFQGGRCRINGPGEYRCGCESQTDCPAAVPQQGIAGQACDLSVHTCNDYCGDLGITPCNGGCCTGPNGSCTPGNTNASCGNNGGTCATCNLKVCTNGACL